MNKRLFAGAARTNLEHLPIGDVCIVYIEQPPEKAYDPDGRHRSTPLRPPHSRGERAATPRTPTYSEPLS